VLISTTQLLSQLTQQLLGYDATTAGLTLGASGLVTLFSMPIAGAITAVSYVGMPTDRTNEASAPVNLMRNLGGSVGVLFVTTALQQPEQFHHERLAEHITAYNGFGFGNTLSHINTAMQAQSEIMSYLDIFWFRGVIALCIWPIALLLPRMPKGAALAR
jgi:DHA2 family multidrug resistance protein